MPGVLGRERERRTTGTTVIMNAQKLIDVAKWLQENGQAGIRSEYEDYERRFRTYPVDEKDHYVYRCVFNHGGFERVLDVVFGKSNMVSEDGIEGLHEAAQIDVVDFINNQKKVGWNRATSFEKALSDAPDWFRKRIARDELEFVPEDPMEDETAEYRDKLKEVLNE